jgi:hypothetical protein
MGVILFCSNCANSHGSFKSFVLSWKEGRKAGREGGREGGRKKKKKQQLMLYKVKLPSTAEKCFFPLYKVNLPRWLLSSAACDLPYGRLECCRRCPIGYQGEPAPTLVVPSPPRVRPYNSCRKC